MSHKSRKAKQWRRAGFVSTKDGRYILVRHPDDGIAITAELIEYSKNADPEKLLPGEIGSFERIVFVETRK